MLLRIYTCNTLHFHSWGLGVNYAAHTYKPCHCEAAYLHSDWVELGPTLCVTCCQAAEETVRRSKLNLVDLAGSERVSKTNIDGTILREAKFINLSLHYLEQVIIALQVSPLMDYIACLQSYNYNRITTIGARCVLVPLSHCAANVNVISMQGQGFLQCSQVLGFNIRMLLCSVSGIQGSGFGGTQCMMLHLLGGRMLLNPNMRRDSGALNSITL